MFMVAESEARGWSRIPTITKSPEVCSANKKGVKTH